MLHASSNLQRSYYGASSYSRVVDLRSDTVTAPSRPMLEAALTTPTGDDVMGEDPTVLKLQAIMADLAGKEAALYLPTGTMANLVAIMAHCHVRSAEIIIGANSHISLWEAGNAASLGGVHTRQVVERDDGSLNHDDIRDAFRLDNDDHCAKTELICLENTHNMRGGAVLDPNDIQATGQLARELGIKLHVDGARIFNAVVASQRSLAELCQGVDSISICLSKGLGAPMGSVLVGDKEFIQLAKRARKRCGGGMRQAGVVAAMGLYAIQNNVERLQQDHVRAKRLGAELRQNGFQLPRDGQVDTNIIFFALPEYTKVPHHELIPLLRDKHGIKLSGGYSRGGELFRICTHMDINEDDVDRAVEAIISLCIP
jgi:threonine aldolase